ncbi:MAG: trigger factor [Lachnospiraceae bacterium]|nr:trigger factor [Lachnospiraceae bacterium]
MKLGKYKGLKISQPSLTVQEAEIDQVLEKRQRENAVVFHIDGRGANWGDEAVLDFEAECKGKPIPNGKRRSYPLRLGSHTFVSGFEDAIVGHSPGERFDIFVTFPDDYRIPGLGGHDAVFHVRLKALRLPEYQEIDDDFARDFSEHDTLADWRTEIRAELEARRMISANEKLARDLMDLVIADSVIPIDPVLKQEIADDLYEDFLLDLEADGMTLETWLRRSGRTEDDLRASQTEEAKRLIQSESVLHAIAEREHLQVSDEELAEEIAALAEEEGESPDLFIQSLGDDELESIIDQLLLDMALSFILEHAILLPE